jgi:hypothetical protein
MEITRSRMGLPYFDSPELEVGRVVGRLDEVALRVDVEEARGLALDLPPTSRLELRLDARLREEGAVAAVHLAQALAHQARGVVHRLHVQMVSSPSSALEWRSRMLITPWVIARLPEESVTMTRSSFFS